MVTARPSRAAARPARGFWAAWFALWAAAGAGDERSRRRVAGELAIVRRGGLSINTLKGWIKQDPATRKKPRNLEQFESVLDELRQRARAGGQVHRIPEMSWPNDLWRRALADSATESATGDDLEVRLTQASLLAFDLMAPEVLPNIDRVADLTAVLGGALADIPTPLAVIGEGGLGKSVLLRQFYNASSSDNADDPFPILVPCSSIPSSADLSGAESLDSALGAVATGDRQAPPLTSLIREVVGNRPVMVLLDTVDLIINDHNVDEVVYVMRAMAGAGARLIFTCRKREYLNFLDSERGLVKQLHEIPDLDPGQIESWARQYTTAADVDPARREAFIASLTGGAAAAVCATPLRLAMACEIYAPTGAIPENLTVTELYNQYWEKRVAADRRGRRTAAARAQEAAADAIAREMWAASIHKFEVSASGKRVSDDAALQRLCSDGVLRQLGNRYQFFHQTYAEYTVARRLRRIGKAKDLERLNAGLQRGSVVGLWQVAGHLVTLEMSDDRYRAVAAAVPLTEAEGIRLHFVGAFHRRDADRVVELGKLVDPALLTAGVGVLADAPAECLAAVSDINFACLQASTSTNMDSIAATCRRLYAALPTGDRASFLRRFLHTALERQPHVTKETLPSVLCRFIDNTVAVDPDDGAIEVLVDFYIDESVSHRESGAVVMELPEAARAALLKAVHKQPVSAAAQTRLLAAAARRPCPSGAVDDLAELLVRNWPAAEFREAIGWSSAQEMLEAQLPARWNGAQVRLAGALCHDAATARDMLAVAFSDADLQRDRWANVAKYIADRHCDLVLDTLLELPDDLGRSPVGTACTVVIHVTDSLSAARRAQLRPRLRRWVDTEPRRAWPTLIKVCIDETELLRDCARELDQLRKNNPCAPAMTTILRSSFDTYLNACTPSQVADLDTDLRALLSINDKQDRNRLAELDGLTCIDNPAAREHVAQHLNGAATNAASAAARGLIAAMSACNRTEFDDATSLWLYSLLETRHAHTVASIAQALASQAAHVEPPSQIAGPMIAKQLTRYVENNEDPQHIGALLTLLIMFEKQGELAAETRGLVVEKLKHAYSQRLPLHTPEHLREHLPALFNLHKQALTALAIPHCGSEDLEQTIRDVLTETDIADITGRSQRTVAHLLNTAASNSPSIVPLLEELWPTVSAANKKAIAECIMLRERGTAGERSKKLARRNDCPIDTQNKIHARFRF